MNIVVTGATSFIGVNVIKKLLLNDENKIWAIIRPNSMNRGKIPISKCINIIELDIKDIHILPEYIHTNIDVFYHFAWEGVRAPYRDDVDIQQANYDSSIKAIHACYKMNCNRFIGSGSQAEYGFMKGKISENYPCNPITEYGKKKHEACCDIMKFANQYNIDCVWGRIFSIYGPGDYSNSLIMDCIDKMKRNEPVKLTQCIQEWDYLYVDELAEIYVSFANKTCSSGIYNVASGVHMILREYVEITKRLLKSNSIIEYGSIPYPSQGIVSFEPDVAKLEKELGWKTSITFEKGIQLMIQGEAYEKD